MKQAFQGWEKVSQRLRASAELAASVDSAECHRLSRFNPGQQASLNAIADRIQYNGVVVADEVGMGKTRIAVEVARCVIECGGRVAILVPPMLGYQWKQELKDGGLGGFPLCFEACVDF